MLLSYLRKLHKASVIMPAIKNLIPANKIYEEISPLVMSNSLYPILTPGKALPHRSVQIIADITIMWGRVNGVGGGVVVFNLLVFILSVFISFDDFITIPFNVNNNL